MKAMRRRASEIIRNLESRVAKLENKYTRMTDEEFDNAPIPPRSEKWREYNPNKVYNYPHEDGIRKDWEEEQESRANKKTESIAKETMEFLREEIASTGWKVVHSMFSQNWFVYEIRYKKFKHTIRFYWDKQHTIRNDRDLLESYKKILVFLKDNRRKIHEVASNLQVSQSGSLWMDDVLDDLGLSMSADSRLSMFARGIVYDFVRKEFFAHPFYLENAIENWEETYVTPRLKRFAKHNGLSYPFSIDQLKKAESDRLIDSRTCSKGIKLLTQGLKDLKTIEMKLNKVGLKHKSS